MAEHTLRPSPSSEPSPNSVLFSAWIHQVTQVPTGGARYLSRKPGHRLRLHFENMAFHLLPAILERPINLLLVLLHKWLNAFNIQLHGLETSD
eukprot:1352552-Pyramimonas_sp.AAC.1